MDDVQACPICGNKLRNYYYTEQSPHSEEVANIVERTCHQGKNHYIQILANQTTGRVGFLKLSLTPDYARFLEINFTTEKCRIVCIRNQQEEYIEIDKLIEPDFPDLVKLKERVSLYVVFS